MRSAKSGPNLWQIWQVFGPWASPYGANGQITMTVHNYRPRQFHRTSNGENPSSGYRDMGSASLAAARPAARPPAHPPARPPARTVTTIPLQPEGLRGNNQSIYEICVTTAYHFSKHMLEYSHRTVCYKHRNIIAPWMLKLIFPTSSFANPTWNSFVCLSFLSLTYICFFFFFQRSLKISGIFLLHYLYINTTTRCTLI